MKYLKINSFGLMLVAVPVVLQFLLLCGMLTVLWSVQHEAMRARESRNRVCRVNDCIVSGFEFAWLMVSTRNNVELPEVLRQIKEIEKDTVSKLDEPNPDAEYIAQTNKARASIGSMTGVAEQVFRQLKVAENSDERLKTIGTVSDKFFQVGDDLSAIIETEQKKRLQIFGLSSDDRKKVQDWIFIFIAVNVLSSIAMTVFFASRIKLPINRISHNLKLLSEKQPLLPASTSKDELGTLDRLIHSVANEVEKAHDRELGLIEKAADLICSLDETGTFLTVNPMAMRMLSLKPSELIGTKLSELTILEDSFAADELIRNSISSNDFQSAGLTLRKADGTSVETRWSCLWSDQEGTLFCVAHDVTKENELARMKQDFMNMISHDLRSPLTSIMGGLTMLTKDKAGVSSEFKEEAESAIRSAEKLIGFIDDLLDFQKLSAGQMPLEVESHNAATLIAEAFELVAALARDRQIELRHLDGAETVLVTCDRQKVVQVIVNLLSNAIKFSPAHSSVLVAAKEEGDNIRFSIIDFGAGVPEDMRVAIFEPFQQTATTKHQGTGLGLAICKMILDAHGGAIGVSANVGSELETKNQGGNGSVFWFTIPK